METKKKNLNRQLVFADIVVDPRGEDRPEPNREVRTRYVKLLYPNGVTLMLLAGIPSSRLMDASYRERIRNGG